LNASTITTAEDRLTMRMVRLPDDAHRLGARLTEEVDRAAVEGFTTAR
jgi:hypothetical protein